MKKCIIKVNHKLSLVLFSKAHLWRLKSPLCTDCFLSLIIAEVMANLGSSFHMPPWRGLAVTFPFWSGSNLTCCLCFLPHVFLSCLCLCPFTFFAPAWNFRCGWQSVFYFLYTKYHARGLCLEKLKTKKLKKYVQGEQCPALWNPHKAALGRCPGPSLHGSSGPRAAAPNRVTDPAVRLPGSARGTRLCGGICVPSM